jgi:hypothetical protein
MLIVGLKGWKMNLVGEEVRLKEWRAGLLRRLLRRTLKPVKTVEGHEALLDLREIVLVEQVPQAEIDAARKAAEDQMKAQQQAQAADNRRGPRGGRVWTPGQGNA